MEVFARESVYAAKFMSCFSNFRFLLFFFPLQWIDRLSDGMERCTELVEEYEEDGLRYSGGEWSLPGFEVLWNDLGKMRSVV